MKRLALALAAACLTAGAAPGLASAAEIQVGSTTTALTAPTCPQESTLATTEADCLIALDKITVYEARSDGLAHPDLITAPGVISAFTLGISGLSISGVSASSLESSANTKYGGPPAAELTVLRRLPSTAAARWGVAAQSPAMPLEPYITGKASGSVTEFPLITPLPVVRGEMLAITIPTWAPILAIGLSSSQFSYVQSHSPEVSTAAGASKKASCLITLGTDQAQLTLGQQALYPCTFPAARVEYSALEITAPAVTASPPTTTTTTTTTTTSSSVRLHHRHKARRRARARRR